MNCECIDCPACKGKGTIWVSMSGRYLGVSRKDDLDQMETCESCDGSGIVEICYACLELERQEMEKLSLARCVAHGHLLPCGWCEGLALALEANQHD